MCEMNYEFVNNNTELTVLFLHGWGLSGKSFDAIINRMKQVSYIKVDLFGFGNSEEPKSYFDVYEYAYQIFLLLRKNNVNKVVIVGHSFGGRLAIILSSIFDIDVHAIPENKKKNEPEHLHYDVRFLLKAPTEDFIISEESNDLKWVSAQQLLSMDGISPSLLRMLQKWQQKNR